MAGASGRFSVGGAPIGESTITATVNPPVSSVSGWHCFLPSTTKQFSGVSGIRYFTSIASAVDSPSGGWTSLTQ